MTFSSASFANGRQGLTSHNIPHALLVFPDLSPPLFHPVQQPLPDEIATLFEIVLDLLPFKGIQVM
jgi:hypothetical protein